MERGPGGEVGGLFTITEKPYRGGADTDDATPDGGDGPHRARFLAEHPDVATAAVEKELLRRLRKHKAPQASITLLWPGLWSALPDAVVQVELKVAEKQGSDCRVLGPDEPAARAAWEAAHPADVKARELLLARLQPMTLALDGEPDGDDAPNDAADGDADGEDNPAS
jgi:hypothetical protein